MLRKSLVFMLFAVFGLIGDAVADSAASGHPQGVWGSEEACALYEAGEDPRPETFWYEIGEQWLERFVFVCFFGASPPEQIGPERWLVLMSCGEDGMRSWYVTLVAEPDNGLSLIWQLPGADDTHQVGPLQACASPA